jgi:membrane protein HdeD
LKGADVQGEQSDPADVTAAAEADRPGPTLIAGVLTSLAGVVAIVAPAVVSVAIELLIGGVLVVAGPLLSVDAFAKGGAARTAFRLVLALATFAAGIYLLVAPLKGTYTLTVMLVIWFVSVGFIQIVMGIAEWKLLGGLVVLSGAVSLVLGILVANRLPEAAAWAIGLLVGVQLICYGLVSIAASYSVRRHQSLARPSA